MKRLPLILSGCYLAIFSGVLIKNVYWSVGDQTDVIRPGIAAFPIGLWLSFNYPGDRNGAFVAVSMAAILNAVAIYYLTRRFTRHKT